MAGPMDNVTAALKARGAIHDGSCWQCPAHDDGRPSLKVDRESGPDGERVLVYCHAGCSTEAVVDALGLSMRDLFDNPAPLPAVAAGEPVAYVYTDENGEPLFRVTRKAKGTGKSFTQSRYAPDDPTADAEGYISRRGCMNGAERVLYRLPQVIAAVREGRPVYVVEGEKDADELARRGHAATTSPQGAGKWKHVREHARGVLAGASVVVVQDKDDPGKAHAREVVDSLQDVAASVRLVEAREGNDTADHLGAGLDVDALVEVEGPDLEPSRIAWELVDLFDHDAEAAPEPDLLRGSNGTALAYSGSRLLLSGEPEAGKSWAALLLAAEYLRDGKRVAWFDTDAMGAAPLRERLTMLYPAAQDARDEQGARLFRYSEADEALGVDELQEIAERLAREGVGLVVMDSWDPALEQAGHDPNSNADVNAFVRAFVNPLFREGVTVALVDHVTKDKEKRGRYSAGAGAKLRAVDVHLGFSTPADRRLDRTRDGSLSVKVHKDRAGHLDRRAVYRVELVHEDAGGITWDVLVKDTSPGADDGWRPTVLMERISRFLELQGVQSGTAITAGGSVRGGKEKLKRALGYLVADGFVETGPGDRAGWTVYRSVKPYREDGPEA